MPTFAALLSSIPRADHKPKDLFLDVLVEKKKGPKSISSATRNLLEAATNIETGSEVGTQCNRASSKHVFS
jgi:hypothetical protein